MPSWTLWQPEHFHRGDTVHFRIGGGLTVAHPVLRARSQYIQYRNRSTGYIEERTYDQVAARTRDGVTITHPDAAPDAA